ncbi:hypothetical protein CHS0354_001014 [Potamilus streckersoni]|uniref:Nose resistant-to-fluoxetine protein N-terminal domain-containing protein n=1 Tax=Potamilus streckersoni TaxID=2493646 RepID=A0AAE0RUT0_9BIVA|nr:hypothetical protein CHS0354_001014 [Potamilus streckersoni]
MEYNLFRVNFIIKLFCFLVLLLSMILTQQVGSNSLNVDKLFAIANSITAVQNFLNGGIINGSSQLVLPFLQQMQRGLGDVVNQMKQDSIKAQHGLNDVCLNHTNLMLEELMQRQGWAMQMIDALGKPGSAFLDGNVQWLGSYDQCVGVEAKLVIDESKVNSATPVHVFKGRYCLARFSVLSVPSSIIPVSLSVGVCVPDSCDDNSVRNLLQTVNTAAGYFFENSSIAVSDVVCHKTIKYDAPAIGVIVVLWAVLASLTIGTLYDVITRFRQNSVKQNPKLKEENETIASFSHEEEKPEKNKQWQGKLGELFVSFSIYTNGKKLLSTKQAAGALTSINGIRFLSMSWVVLGHSYSASALIIQNMKQFLDVKSHQWSFMAISNATISVDSFFLLSGLLVAYLTLREIKKMGGIKKFRWGMFYFHRFWRLTPPYMLMLVTNAILLKYWFDGPLWNQDGYDTENCENSWWTNLLYINNLVHTDKMCMTWSWYLANDMQFFVLSPLILIPLYM